MSPPPTASMIKCWQAAHGSDCGRISASAAGQPHPYCSWANNKRLRQRLPAQPVATIQNEPTNLLVSQCDHRSNFGGASRGNVRTVPSPTKASIWLEWGFVGAYGTILETVPHPAPAPPP